jgi:hypothetical protein
MRGGYLEEDLYGYERGREWPDDQIVDGGTIWREMRRVRE